MTEAGRSEGRVALVMAASKGLGYGCAEALAERRYKLVVCARGAADVEAAASRLRGSGVQVLAMAADVSKPSDLERVFAEAQERFGGVDVLVSNAGGPPPGSFLQDFGSTVAGGVRADADERSTVDQAGIAADD